MLSQNDDYDPYAQLITHGLSEDSLQIADSLKQAKSKQYEPVSIDSYRCLRDEITDAIASHSEPDWNGAGAKALMESAYIGAESFIKTLPYSAPLPVVRPQPIGYLGFTWERENDIIFSVTATMDRLYYAGLLGDKKVNGQSRNNCQPDETIFNILKTYFS